MILFNFAQKYKFSEVRIEEEVSSFLDKGRRNSRHAMQENTKGKTIIGYIKLRLNDKERYHECFNNNSSADILVNCFIDS